MNKRILVIVDGAVFGSQMNKIERLIGGKDNVLLCLPESFEWLILKSGIVKYKELNKVLLNPSDYIDSKLYLSWEIFFTEYLKRVSKDTVFKYLKTKLSKRYIIEENMKKIAKEIL